MAQKTIAFYHPAGIDSGNGKTLRLDIAPVHVACAVIADGKPYAFEFFELADDINDWSDVFFEIKRNSVLLEHHFDQVFITCNFKEAVMIPVEKSSNAAGEDFLALLFGDNYTDDTKHDKLDTEKPMMNVYRVKKSIHEQALRHFHLYQFKHIYTEIVESLSQNQTPHLLFLQVYQSTFIVTLWDNNQLQFIQTYDYSCPEDIGYHILALLKEYQLQPEDIMLEMSGFIEPHGELHRKLQMLFVNRQFKQIPESLLLPGMLESHHPHTFTPFFNSII